MKTLKFLRDVAVAAIHREAGSIHDIEDYPASILIGSGDAVLFEKPEKTKPETAESKAPKENAARKTK
jgi:hypothetical protein